MRYDRPSLLVMIPPPIVFGICFGTGTILGRWLPQPHWIGTEMARSVGWVLIMSAAGVGLISMGCFAWQRTTVIPIGQPARLVTAGPFALSRNPMYLSLSAAYCGGALIIAQFWVLALVVVPLGILRRIVVPFEEQRMRSLFGERYARYCDRVRRWV